MFKKKPKRNPVVGGSKLPEETKELLRQKFRQTMPEVRRLPSTQEQLTDVQLALIEIYEVMLDG